MLYHDKTKYDQKVAEFVTDYIDLAKRLIKFAKEKGASEAEIKGILDSYGESRFRTGKRRRNIDLLKGRFAIKKVIRIERKDDPDAISQKWADYSSGSINKLFAQGINDTLSAINNLKLN